MAGTIPALDGVPPERLAYLRRLQEEKERRDAEHLAGLDVFKLIGYEPNCQRRFEVRRRAAAKLGIENAFDWRVTEAVAGTLPAPCGKCPQEMFHAATEDAVLYGGASGGGKSAAITAEGIKWCARYPGLRVLLVRCSYDELEESIFPALRKFGFAEALGARWNSIKRELRFPNGSVFRFRYLETLDDASKRQGGEYQLLLVDEMTLMVPGVVDILRYERLRSAGGLPVIGMRATSNPGGPSHGQVKIDFIEATGYGRKVVKDDHGLTVRFIQARATDNPHLDPAHKKRLDAIPDPARRAAMRDGDWDQWSGMIFKEWRAERHTIEPVALPATLSRFCGIDWGFAKPWAVLWGAVEDGRLWIYRELYAAGVGESDQAAQILAAEEGGERVFARWADDSMWSTRGESLPIATVYAQNGVALTPAGKGPNSRVQGWQRIHSYMKEAPACPHHRAQGWPTCPNLHIFSTCSNLIFEIKNLPHATTGNPEDADPKAVDHACLVAGTLVGTVTGPRPIEHVRAGDYVQTRSGPKRVLAAGLTVKDAPVGTVLLSNGAQLRGTANHPVWVQGFGWKRMDALRYSDIVSVCPAANQLSSTASPSGATRTQRTGLTACTSRPAAVTASVVFSASTRKSGRHTTVARSHRDMTSTTRTATRSTTTRPTWNACPKASMVPIMPLSVTGAPPSVSPIWRRSGRWPQNGTGRMKAGRGTASTPGRPSETARWSFSPALTAARSTRPTPPASRGSAPATASTVRGSSRALMTRREPASCAAPRSGSTSTCRNASAPVSVLAGMHAEREPHDVYNLTIEGAHEFYANGALVHNCDALRYLTINLGGGAQFYDSPEPERPIGTEVLAPMGNWAVREDPGEAAKRALQDPENKQGATQTWEQALAKMGQR